MHCFNFDAVIFFFIIFGIQNVFTFGCDQGWKGATLLKGCHTFIGKVQCHDSNKSILASAKIVGWNCLKNESISAKINSNGTYKFDVCVSNKQAVELLLEFNDVCFPGQSYQVSNPKQEVFITRILPSGLFPNSILKNRDAKNVSSRNLFSSKPHRQLRHQQYPPMPRPYSHRISNGHNFGYMNDTSDGGFESNTLMLETHYRKSFKPPSVPRPYDRRYQQQQQNIHSMENVEDEGVRSLRTKKYIQLPKGNYIFKGRVECYSKEYGITSTVYGTPIVKLMENDIFGDDFINATKLQPNGAYEISGYVDDGKLFPNVELYLLFEHVCWMGDSYIYGAPEPGKFWIITLTEGVGFRKPHQYGAPYYRRRRHMLHSNLMNVENNQSSLREKRTTVYLAPGNYTFKGIVKCFSTKFQYTPIETTALVKLMEHDLLFFDSDDIISISKIKRNGEFEISGLADEILFFNVELYLQFENVCWTGDSYVSSSITEPDTYIEFKLSYINRWPFTAKGRAIRAEEEKDFEDKIL